MGCIHKKGHPPKRIWVNGSNTVQIDIDRFIDDAMSEFLKDPTPRGFFNAMIGIEFQVIEQLGFPRPSSPSDPEYLRIVKFLDDHRGWQEYIGGVSDCLHWLVMQHFDNGLGGAFSGVAVERQSFHSKSGVMKSFKLSVTLPVRAKSWTFKRKYKWLSRRLAVKLKAKTPRIPYRTTSGFADRMARGEAWGYTPFAMDAYSSDFIFVTPVLLSDGAVIEPAPLAAHIERPSTSATQEFSSVARAGLGQVSADKTYVRAINAIDKAGSSKAIGKALGALIKDRGEVTGFSDEKLDVEHVRDAAKTLADLFTKYPAIRAGVSVGNLANPTAAACVSPRGMRRDDEGSPYPWLVIIISRRCLMNGDVLSKDFRKSVESGWHVSVTEDVMPMHYVMTHEFGHVIDYTMFPHKMLDEAGAGQSCGQNTDGIDRQDYPEEKVISQYANRSHNELLAEAFVDAEMNDVNAAEYSKLLHRQMVGGLNQRAIV